METQKDEVSFENWPSLKVVGRQTFRNPPILTVAIRVKNEMKGIPALLESLRSQTIFEATELLFLDSGSTDGTVELLTSQPYSLYTVGPEDFLFGSSCNLCMQLATADLVCFLSGHVTLTSKGLLEKAIATIREHRASAAYFRQIPGDREQSNAYERAYLAYRYRQYRRPFKKITSKSHSFSNAGSIVTKAAWDHCKFPAVRASEDYLWVESLLGRGETCLYLPHLEIVHAHRESPERIRARVSSNVTARGRSLWTIAIGLTKCFTVFIGVLLYGGGLTEALQFAKEHGHSYFQRSEV